MNVVEKIEPISKEGNKKKLGYDIKDVEFYTLEDLYK